MKLAGSIENLTSIFGSLSISGMAQRALKTVSCETRNHALWPHCDSQYPRLGIKESSNIVFISVQRVVINGKQLLQRDQLGRAQQLEMSIKEISQIDFAIIFYIESAVILGETFVKPRRF